MKRHWLTALVAVAALALVSSSAKASLLTSFSGNTQPSFLGTIGYIDFAVYDTAGGVAGDRFGTGDATMDASLAAFGSLNGGTALTSSFLYLYQNVNTGVDIASGSVNANGATLTSAGFLATLGFTQVTAGHPFLGAAAAAPGNPSPAVTGATAANGTPIVVAGLVAPTTVSAGASSVVATYGTRLNSANGNLSTLWGFTSNIAPAFNFGSIQDSGPASNGTVPSNSASAVPEPSSLAIAGLGALGLIGYGLRRRKALGA